MKRQRIKGNKRKVLQSSFRDPSGFLFVENGEIYRQINQSYKENYKLLKSSGLYGFLIKNRMLVSHKEIRKKVESDVFKIIKPKEISFISYPYEWCFSQLKDAALLTLEIQKKALSLSMTLKDASAYNIQFENGRPLLIDSLSFEKYQDDKPWTAYKQFCQHFLAPLTLMSYADIRLGQLFRVFIDGIPLDLTCRLLPFSARFNFPLFLHIFLHAKTQKHFSDKSASKWKKINSMNRNYLLTIIDSLKSAVEKLKWEPKNTEWIDYYHENKSYFKKSWQDKKKLVTKLLAKIKPKTMWDLGANTGVFSQISAKFSEKVISFDSDAAAVEKHYLRCKRKKESNILPLLLDLTNPSPDIGWQNQERMSIIKRARADTVLALAFIHHLTISNNIPFKNIAEFFYKICHWLIIEFVPRGDEQVKKLLSFRKDIFIHYNKKMFEKEFSSYFKIENEFKIRASKRILYLMKKRV